MTQMTGFHVKLMPELPGYEMAVTALHRLDLPSLAILLSTAFRRRVFQSRSGAPNADLIFMHETAGNKLPVPAPCVTVLLSA